MTLMLSFDDHGAIHRLLSIQIYEMIVGRGKLSVREHSCMLNLGVSFSVGGTFPMYTTYILSDLEITW